MKIDVIEPMPVPMPPRKFVLELTEEEMRAVLEVANFNYLVADACKYPSFVKDKSDVQKVLHDLFFKFPEPVRDSLRRYK